jgi:hypothetical protein
MSNIQRLEFGNPEHIAMVRYYELEHGYDRNAENVYHNFVVTVRLENSLWDPTREQFVISAQTSDMAEIIADKEAFKRYSPYLDCMDEAAMDDIVEYEIESIELIEKADQWPAHIPMI